MFENILGLYPLGEMAKRLLTEYVFPKAIMAPFAPDVEIAPEGETVCVIPIEEMNTQGVRPYRGGADLEFEVLQGESKSLTTQLWNAAHLLLPETLDGRKRQGLSPAQVEAEIAAVAQAKFIARKQAAISTFLHTDGNYDGNVDTSAHKWNTSDGDPLGDLNAMAAALDAPPTVVGMSQAAYLAMVNNENFKGNFSNFTIGSPNIVRDVLAAYMGITGLELVIDEGRGYVPSWYSGAITPTKYFDTDVIMLSNSTGLNQTNAFLVNGDPIMGFAVNCYQKGVTYPDQGWVQLATKGKAAAYVIYDYFKVNGIKGKCGYRMKAVI